MKINKKRNGIILTYIYFVLNTVLTIFIGAFVVRSVGKTDYGVHQSMTAFINYLVLLEFGTSTLMARNLAVLNKDGSEEEKVKKNVSTIWTLTIVLSLLILIGIIIFYFLTEYIYSNSLTNEQVILGKKILIFSGTNLIFNFLSTTLFGLLIAFEQYVYEKSLMIFRLILRTTLIVIFFTISHNILYFSIIDASLSFLTFVITLVFVLIKIKVPLNPRYFDKNILKTSIPFATAILLQGLVSTANGTLDKFLISIMMKPEDVAVYSISTMIYAMYSSIGTTPTSMFMPGIAKAVREGKEGKELTKVLVQSARLNTFTLGVVGVGFILVGRPFIEMVYGVDFGDAWLYAIILIIPAFFNLCNMSVVTVLDIYNKRLTRSLVLLGVTVLNLVITIFGIMWFGMIGAAIGTAISVTVQVIILNIYYNQKMGIDIPYLFKESFKGILINLIIAGLITLPLYFVLKSNILKFFVMGIAFVLIFFVLFLAFGINPDEKKYLKQFFSKFKKKKKVN